MKRTHSDRTYLSWHPWSGRQDDDDARLTDVAIVKVRKPQVCTATDPTHEIPPGTRARREKAIFDGEWRSWYACLGCIDREIEEYEA